jgi:hypothetical protein
MSDHILASGKIMASPVRELIQNLEHSRPDQNNEQRGKEEKGQRAKQLDGGLLRRLFSSLAPLRAQRVGVNADGARD